MEEYGSVQNLIGVPLDDVWSGHVLALGQQRRPSEGLATT